MNKVLNLFSRVFIIFKFWVWYFNTNITAYYEIADDMFVGVTANNIFDAFPDRDAAYGGSSYYPFFVNANLYPITGPAVSAVFSARF